jgi:SAM-dependent methyltransferase
MNVSDVPAAYDLIAEKFFADRSVALREKKYLDRILADVRPGAKVLDFGCGTGRPIAEHLIARGFNVTGVDGSAGMLAIARRIVPTARLVQERLEEIDFAETFAAAVAWDSLFHVDREHHAAIYAKLARWLAPGGRLLLSSGGTEDPGFTDRMHGETFFYSSWRPERVIELLEAAGFAVELCEVDQPMGRGHVAIVARRTS